VFDHLFSEDVATAHGDPKQPVADLLPEEEALIARAVPKRRREFAMGRTCARTVLERLGVTGFALLSGPKREPIWPAGIVGSVTHTEGLCAAVAAHKSQYAGIGIDAEPDLSLDAQLAEVVCLPEELASIPKLGFMDPHVVPRLVFSAKEAVFKCQFYLTRRFLDFHDVRIEVRSDGTFRVRMLTELPEPVGAGASLVGRWARRGGFLLTAAWLPYRSA
jgi:4'-phosphopantetheinyl transferase EntD